VEKGDTRHTPELVPTAFAAALATLPEVPNLREGLSVILPYPREDGQASEARVAGAGAISRWLGDRVVQRTGTARGATTVHSHFLTFPLPSPSHVIEDQGYGKTTHEPGLSRKFEASRWWTAIGELIAGAFLLRRDL